MLWRLAIPALAGLLVEVGRTVLTGSKGSRNTRCVVFYLFVGAGMR